MNVKEHCHHRKGDRAKWFYTKMTLWQRVCTLIAAGAVVIGLAWANLAEPRIDCQIDKKILPIQDAIEYQNFLMMSTLTDEQVNRATQRYLNSKNARTKK